eukprot:m51a1_g13084 hypothetical protein (119) ;mRNA; f:867-5677
MVEKYLTTSSHLIQNSPKSRLRAGTGRREARGSPAGDADALRSWTTAGIISEAASSSNAPNSAACASQGGSRAGSIDRSNGGPEELAASLARGLHVCVPGRLVRNGRGGAELRATRRT